METVRHAHNERIATASGSRVSNDNRRSHPRFGHSLFPEQAVARIFKPSRSVTTSGTARTRGWRLVFDRRSAPFIEPLMGYTGSADTLTQVELKFPTLESAIRYAERQGLTYVVQRRPSQAAAQATQGIGERSHQPPDAFADATLERPGLAALQQNYRPALDGKANQAAMWSFPIGVARDPTLSLEAKRSIRSLLPSVGATVPVTSPPISANGWRNTKSDRRIALLAIRRRRERSSVGTRP